jgi:hypothetical protein
MTGRRGDGPKNRPLRQVPLTLYTAYVTGAFGARAKQFALRRRHCLAATAFLITERLQMTAKMLVARERSAAELAQNGSHCVNRYTSLESENKLLELWNYKQTESEIIIDE